MLRKLKRRSHLYNRRRGNWTKQVGYFEILTKRYNQIQAYTNKSVNNPYNLIIINTIKINFVSNKAKNQIFGEEIFTYGEYLYTYVVISQKAIVLAGDRNILESKFSNIIKNYFQQWESKEKERQKFIQQRSNDLQ